MTIHKDDLISIRAEAEAQFEGGSADLESGWGSSSHRCSAFLMNIGWVDRQVCGKERTMMRVESEERKKMNSPLIQQMFVRKSSSFP
jgi:hypothetical protein